MSDKSFTGTIPTELGDLTGLTEFQLHKNSLNGTDWCSEISQLTSEISAILFRFSDH